MKPSHHSFHQSQKRKRIRSTPPPQQSSPFPTTWSAGRVEYWCVSWAAAHGSSFPRLVIWQQPCWLSYYLISPLKWLSWIFWVSRNCHTYTPLRKNRDPLIHLSIKPNTNMWQCTACQKAEGQFVCSVIYDCSTDLLFITLVFLRSFQDLHFLLITIPHMSSWFQPVQRQSQVPLFIQ